MAKSLRSKIKQKHKSIRRKTIYQPVEDARLERLAAKQAADQCPEFIIGTPLNPEEAVVHIEHTVVSELPTKTISLAEKIEKKKQKFDALKAKIKAKKALGGETIEMDSMEEAPVRGPKKSHKKSNKPRGAKARLRW